jgi:nickel-type superoxide dismutase maturation protease
MLLTRFRVADTSMQPALLPDDRLLVTRWAPIRTGAIVVFADPEARGEFCVKRVTDIAPDGTLVVRGDNPNVSRDSRHFGGVPPSLLVGRVVYRYLPGTRRGPVGRCKVRGMEVALAAIALVVAIVALAIAWRVREHFRAVEERLDAAELQLARAENEVREMVADVRAQLVQTSRDVSELKAATEIVPAPPLPRGRSRPLDDLRERLRASHREEDAESDADA